MQERKAFSELSKEVRERPGAAQEVDAHKRAIIAAVRHTKKGETETADANSRR